MSSKADKYQVFIDYFKEHLPNPTTELCYNTPFELMVAVVLSAQCKDHRVNQVTPALFARFPDPYAMAETTFEHLLPYIRTISYPRSKTRYLLETAKLLCLLHGGELPRSSAALQELPGVGRKTAHVLLSELYQEPTLAVDTHVMRVSKRIGLVSERHKTPLAIERELTHYIPKDYIHRFHHWLIQLGRYTCLARRPKCAACPLKEICNYYQKKRAAN